MSYEGRKIIVQSVVAFYAAVVGFGLQNLLNPTLPAPVGPPPDTRLLENRWVCFMILGLLGFRLFTGASIHLIVEHTGSRASHERIGGMVLDIAALLGFSVLLLQGAYATDVGVFFLWLLITILTSLAWFPVNQLWSPTPSDKTWRFFWQNDLTHFLAALVSAAVFYMDPSRKVYHWSLGLLLCLGFTTFVSAKDVYDQIRVAGDA